MVILNNGPVPVRVAGRWLQPGENTEVDAAVALRLMSANPDVVEPGKEPERQPPPVNVDKPTEDVSVVYEVQGEAPFRKPTGRKK